MASDRDGLVLDLLIAYDDLDRDLFDLGFPDAVTELLVAVVKLSPVTLEQKFFSELLAVFVVDLRIDRDDGELLWSQP